MHEYIFLRKLVHSRQKKISVFVAKKKHYVAKKYGTATDL
jgi:hypothetical protein